MDSSGHHFQLQSDGSILLRCGTDVSDANKLIIARDLLTVPVARQLGENTTMHAAVAPSNTVLLEKELVGTLQPKDDSDCGWNILFCADAPSQVPFFFVVPLIGERCSGSSLVKIWSKSGLHSDKYNSTVCVTRKAWSPKDTELHNSSRHFEIGSFKNSVTGQMLG